MKLQDLTPNPENPRHITDEKLAALKKSLQKYGDLSGIVFNQKTGKLIGGHQRQKVIENAEVTLTKELSTPSSTGTVAYGNLEFDGEIHSVRIVEVDEVIEKEMNLAANQHARSASWDFPKLTEWVIEIDSHNKDIEAMGWDEAEHEELMAYVKTSDQDSDTDDKNESDSKAVHEVTCPSCGHQWQWERT